MKNIAILVPETAVVEAVVDPRYMFTAVNDFLRSMGKPPAFNVQLVGMKQEVRLLDGLISIHTDVLLQNADKPHLIIIPAISGNIRNAIDRNRDFIPWIVEQYKNGAEVASLCIGAFLLAATKLLNGKSCSTHWLYANEFRNMFPDIELVDHKIITEQGGLYSSGGANSYWSLLLYLVEKYTSRDLAILASKFFVLDIDKQSQSPFTIFKGQKQHEDDAIIKAQDFIESNYQEKITVEQLSERFCMGRRSFERRFKKATHNSVIEYLQRVKVEAAKKHLEHGRKTVNEIMYEVGYTDIKAFREVFKKVTSMSPLNYRLKYCREAI